MGKAFRRLRDHLFRPCRIVLVPRCALHAGTGHTRGMHPCSVAVMKGEEVGGSLEVIR